MVCCACARTWVGSGAKGCLHHEPGRVAAVHRVKELTVGLVLVLVGRAAGGGVSAAAWRLLCVQRLRVGVSSCVVLPRLPRGVRLLQPGLPPPPVWLPLPLVAPPLFVARVLCVWRYICVLRLRVLCLLARVLGVTRLGELALEHRTLRDELLVPLKRHCQLALVRACNRVLLCAWRLPRVMCLRLRVRV